MYYLLRVQGVDRTRLGPGLAGQQLGKEGVGRGTGAIFHSPRGSRSEDSGSPLGLQATPEAGSAALFRVGKGLGLRLSSEGAS